MVNVQEDLLSALAQLAAGIPRHRVSRWLLGQSSNWDGFTSTQLTWQIRASAALGSDLRPVLERLRLQHEAVVSARNSIEQALAVPKLTAKLIGWMPWVALAMAQVMGLQPLKFLLFNPLGWVILALAAVLQWLSFLAGRKILHRYKNLDYVDPGAHLEAVSLGLRTGVSLRRVTAVVRHESGDSGLDLSGTAASARTLGIGLSHLLDAQTQILRRRQSHELASQLERLPVKLLLPLAGFLVPQFMLLTVVPVAVSSVLF